MTRDDTISYEDHSITCTFNFNAVLALAHFARTKRLTDNEILQVMTGLPNGHPIRALHVESAVNRVIAERKKED